MIDISIVIPCYCAEKNIDIVIDKIYQAMKLRPDIVFEIILVNDNSKDGTWYKIKELSEIHSEIVGINFSKNFGQHNALMAGFKASNGTLIMTSDDDGQTPIDKIWDFMDKINEGYDVVCAKYIARERKGISRKLGSYINERTQQKLLDKPKNIALASFFMAKRFVIEEICKYEQPFPYLAGLLLRTTQNISNIELIQEQRASGKSGYNLKKLIRLWVNGFTSFSVKPLHFFIKLGFGVSTLGGILAIYAIIKKIIYEAYVLSGYTSMVAIICLIGGMNLMVLGVVGEYIGRIYMCINNYPQYVIKSVVKGGHELNEL